MILNKMGNSETKIKPFSPDLDIRAFHKSIDTRIEYEELCCDSDKKIFNFLEDKCQIDIIDRRKNIL